MSARSARSLWANRQGVGAVEFALILPVMLALILGAVDGTGYIQAYRHTQQAADMYARVLSQWVGTSANGQGVFDDSDLGQMVTTIPFIIPEVLSQGARVHQDWTSSFIFTLSYVEMVNTDTNTPQAPVGSSNLAQPQLYWSITTGSMNDQRCRQPVGTPAPCLNISPALPASLQMVAGRLVVADVTFTYIPLFLPSIFAHTFNASAYISTRYGQAISLSGQSQANGYTRWN